MKPYSISGDLVLTVKVPVKLSNNNAGQGNSWHKSANDRKKIEKLLKSMRLQREPFKHPCTIEIIRVLGHRQRLWDFDSIGRGSAKQLIDSLVAVGWFFDDKPEHIRGCFYHQDNSQRENGPATIINVYRFDG